MPARPTTKPPRIAPLSLGALAAGDPAELHRGADLDGLRYADLAVAELSLRGAKLVATQFVDLAAEDADLSGARLSEVELDRADLPVVRAARGQWRDVRVTGRLGSLEAWESNWRAVHFVGCKLGFVNLRGAELLDVAFTDCVITELDLGSAVLHRVRLSQTRVDHLVVHRAELHDVDLRGARLGSVDGLTDLRGSTITPDQLTDLAPLLAEGLGIAVES